MDPAWMIADRCAERGGFARWAWCFLCLLAMSSDRDGCTWRTPVRIDCTLKPSLTHVSVSVGKAQTVDA